MKLVPLIYIKERSFYFERDGKTHSEEEVIDSIDHDKLIYVLDIDGIEKDKPNLCTYQRQSSMLNLWVDFGPRTKGDIVDSFLAGAEKVTVRKYLYPKINPREIKEMIEKEFYTNIELEKQRTYDINDPIFYDSYGLVNFYSKEEIESNMGYYQRIKALAGRKIYSYEDKTSNISFWERLGFSGIIVEYGKMKDFERWMRK
jgi:hypothetical protein